jgi:hypothetical protein
VGIEGALDEPGVGRVGNEDGDRRAKATTNARTKYLAPQSAGGVGYNATCAAGRLKTVTVTRTKGVNTAAAIIPYVRTRSRILLN